MSDETGVSTLRIVLLGLEVEIAFATDVWAGEGDREAAQYLTGWRDCLERLGGAGLLVGDPIGPIRLRLETGETA